MPNPRSTAQIAGHPIHPMLIPFPVVFLVTAFATDIAFWIKGAAIRATASMWLLGAGGIMALVAAVFGFTDFFGSLLLLFNGWKGWELVYRHHVGVAEQPAPKPELDDAAQDGVIS